jgi:hypothetical protein
MASLDNIAPAYSSSLRWNRYILENRSRFSYEPQALLKEMFGIAGSQTMKKRQIRELSIPKGLCLLATALTFVLNPRVNAQTNIPPFGIIFFGVQSNIVNVGINSSAAGVYTLQALSDLHDYWVEITNRPGTGLTLAFSDAGGAATRFYRVAGVSLAKLTLFPAVPTLGSNAVSLPDAVSGVPYAIDISPVATGSGPYTLAISNSLPDGVSAAIISNQTVSALVRLSASGASLVDGQRRQFTVTVSDNLGAKFGRL